MHLIASMPNAPMMELIHEPPHGPYSAFMDIFTDPPLMNDGYISVPGGPGLGITIRPDLIES
jgi:L-alanine-DL-glutamate epimerase-like enolase superfamily enzyme